MPLLRPFRRTPNLHEKKGVDVAEGAAAAGLQKGIGEGEIEYEMHNGLFKILHDACFRRGRNRKNVDVCRTAPADVRGGNIHVVGIYGRRRHGAEVHGQPATERAV